jgi:hypothetical protein
MRAAIHQSEELAPDVEDCDWPIIDGEEFSRARRQLGHRCNDVTCHQLKP